MKHCPICFSTSHRRIKVSEDRIALLGCQQCQAAYWEDVWDQKKVQDHYGPYYTPKNSQHDPITQKRYHKVLDKIEELTSVGRLLDIGCGSGQFLLTAKNRGWNAMGNEVSQSAIGFLEQMKATHHMKFEVFDKNIQEVNLPSDSMDAVCMIEVVEHLEDPMGMFREAYRILNKGGVMYLTTPNFNSLSRYLVGNEWHVIGAEHRVLFTPKALHTCLSLCGFRPETILTKNINLMEVIKKFRRTNTSESARSLAQSTENLRCTVEKSVWLGIGKTLTNLILRFLSLGDTIEIFAIKT